MALLIDKSTDVTGLDLMFLRSRRVFLLNSAHLHLTIGTFSGS